MIPKVEVIQHMNNVVRLVLILQPQVVQNPDLHQRLVVKPLLVPYDLDGNLRADAMIKCSDDLPEGTLADNLQDLVPVCYVVVDLLWTKC